MKVVYIAHPISGNIEKNLLKVKIIARKINMKEPDVVPFTPYYLDCIALDDNNPVERERGIKNDIELMKRGFIDEVRLYGNRISKGMRAEVKLAIQLGITVRPMTNGTKAEFKALYGVEVFVEPLAKTESKDKKQETQEKDHINPAHYRKYPLQSIEMMEGIWGTAATSIFCEMTAFKYRMRLGQKDAVEQEQKKEQWYLDKAKELQERINTETEIEGIR